MAAFHYQAVDAKGKQQKGVMEGDSARQIRHKLREKGWMPLSVETTVIKQSPGTVSKNGHRLTVMELSLLTRQLATLIAAGLPIDESLRALSEQTEKQRTKAMILAIRSKVLEGYTLAKALGEYPKAFPHLYRSTVSAGEHAGHLDGVLNRLAEYTEARQQANQKIQLAAMYPAILSLVAIGIIVGLLTYVVPDIVEVFVKNGQELPGLTQFMLDLSYGITNYGFHLLVALFLFVTGFSISMRKPAFRAAFHRFLLSLPGIGGFIKDTNTARFGSTLAILTSSGVPLVEAMRIASQVISNIPIKDALTEATVVVSEGASLHQALAETRYFPPIMLHMIASGENSGELDSMLARTAHQQETTLANTVTAMVSIFEPLMLVGMGAIVALIVAAIMLPILELQNMVQ